MAKKRLKKKKKPRFTVMNVDHVKRIGNRWRKPRGIDNKKKAKHSFAGKSPRIGYRNSSEVRNMHPSGFQEVLVHNSRELEGLKERVVRIGSAVGAKKKKVIEAKAKELGLKVLNKSR